VLMFDTSKCEIPNPEVSCPQSFCICTFLANDVAPLFHFVFGIYNRQNPIDLCYVSQTVGT
jgi:hypothetical protein